LYRSLAKSSERFSILIPLFSTKIGNQGDFVVSVMVLFEAPFAFRAAQFLSQAILVHE